MNRKEKQEKALKNAKKKEENRSHRRNVRQSLKLGYYDSLHTEPRRVVVEKDDE